MQVLRRKLLILLLHGLQPRGKVRQKVGDSFFISSVIGPLAKSARFQQSRFLHGRQIRGDDRLRKPGFLLDTSHANPSREFFFDDARQIFVQLIRLPEPAKNVETGLIGESLQHRKHFFMFHYSTPISG